MDSDQAGQKSAFKNGKWSSSSWLLKLKIVKTNWKYGCWWYLFENMEKDKLKELVTSSQKVFQYLIDNVINKIETNNIKDITEFKKIYWTTYKKL